VQQNVQQKHNPSRHDNDPTMAAAVGAPSSLKQKYNPSRHDSA
jgi:hypothetical protein